MASGRLWTWSRRRASGEQQQQQQQRQQQQQQYEQQQQQQQAGTQMWPGEVDREAATCGSDGDLSGQQLAWSKQQEQLQVYDLNSVC
jgi:hypothetical protein